MHVQAIYAELNGSSQVWLERGIVQEDGPRFLGCVGPIDEAFARIRREEYARSSWHGCHPIEELGGWDVHDFLDGSQTAVLAVTIEVEPPRAPAADSSKTGGVAEVANIHCKDVGIIFGNPQRADRTIELVHKLDGIGSWIDLPDLRFVNQSDQDLTIGPDRYVFDPGIVREVVDGANTSIGIAFADNEPINGVLSEAKKEKQNARNRQHSRRLVAES